MHLRPSASALTLLLAATAAFATAPKPKPAEVTSGTVLEDVTIVNTRDGSLTAHRSIVLEDGKIKSILTGKIHISGSAKVINASGKFIVPGFIDIHAHAIDTADSTPTFFPLFFANGVTSVREESVTPAFVKRVEKLDADEAAGTVFAPTFIIQGVEQHIPPMTTAFAFSDAGQPSIDHLGAGPGLVLDCSTDEPAIRKAILTQGFHVTLPPPMAFIINPRAFDAELNAPFYQRIIDSYSEDRCKKLAATFVKNHTAQSLTLIRLKTQDYGNDPMYRDSPLLQYISKERRDQWNSLGDRFAKLSPSTVKTLQAYYELQKRVTKLMLNNGVLMLAGSDVGGIWLVPGFSMHQEFHELTASGFTPLQVLQSATLNNAEFLHRADSLGTVDEGKIADLVVLDANPIADVTALDTISGVVVKGQYLGKPELEKLKSDVAQAYK